MKKLMLICAPVSSRSGYGDHARDLVRAFIKHDKYDINIFDDRCSFEDAGEALLEWYNVGPEERERCGELGREFVNGDGRMTAKHLSESFIKNIEATFKNWKPREQYTLEVV